MNLDHLDFEKPIAELEEKLESSSGSALKAMMVLIFQQKYKNLRLNVRRKPKIFSRG